jgi:UDP-N-acetylenolpyruvoylglucosamine reductase
VPEAVTSLTSQQVNALLDSAGSGSVVYLIAAGGCGVSGLGHLLLDLGFAVHGSDLVENEEVRQLRARGATIHIGHRAEQLRAAKPVLVVYSSAIRSDNVEVQAARELDLPIVRRAVLLAALVARQRGVCVAGMHGKTTTISLLAYALEKLGANPSYAIGSLVPQLRTHARFSKKTAPASPSPLNGERAGVRGGLSDDAHSREERHETNHPSPSIPLPVEGRGKTDALFAGESAPLFVVEADESDGTLREFQPTHSIILNVDEEHLDYFVNVQNVCREFEQFAASTKELVLFCADDQRLVEMMQSRANAISFGFNSSANYCAEIIGAGTFAVSRDGAKLGEFAIQLVGEKNISNACAVIAFLHQLGYAPDAIREAIKDFRGAARRQQELFASESVRVIDDYGHHPAEIRATLWALKQPAGKRLVVAFQPHRYTRTAKLMQQFAESFEDADKLFLTDVYAASEPEIAGANSAVLAAAIRERGQQVTYVPVLSDLVEAVRVSIQPGDVILFLGAGDITKAAHQLADELRMQTSGPVTPGGGVFEKLRATLSSETTLLRDEYLAKRTTLRVGGKADVYVEPASEADLAAVLRTCSETKTPFTIIGRGSNLLIKDGGIRGVVICLCHPSFSKFQIIGEHMHCGAGVKLKTVSVEARRAGLAGLEFLEGIPGSVGGALRMNAGAMGSWMFEVVEQIRFMDFSGNVHERKASEVNVEYRGCPLFKTHIALGAVLRGTPATKEAIQERANTFNSKRWETQPAQPSAGCIFKNPKTVPAGKLIDELGLKGTKKGGAMVSTVHGNFIVNEGGATAKDVLELIQFIKETAKAKRGIELETEVEILGE